MRRLLATSILIVTLALPSVAHAGPAATGDTGPPAETSPPAVTNETEYRDAITDLSADSSGPHVITLGGPITLVSAVDPEYSGTEDLTIDGNGFVLDGAENSRILKMNTSVALTIEDITMTRGVATGTGTRQGGAVFTTGPLTIRDAVFTANEAKSTDGSGSGGAVYASTGPAAAVTIEDATFIKNAAIGETFAGGGALAVGGVSTLTLTRATFDTNVADGGSGNASGGAINGNASAVDVTDSVFAENGATAAMGGNGGALSLSVVSSVAVQSTALTSNVATGPTSAGGGAMNLSSAAGATLTVEDSTVSGNRVETTTGVADGGGLRINTMPTTIRGSLVSGNRAQSAGLGSWGGGISFNTAASPLRTIQIADSTIIANQATGATAATKGGGVRASVISAATVLIMNNSTVTANTASGASGEGGGLWSKGTSLDHVTLASNTANTGANFFSQSGGGGFTRSVFGDPLGSGDNCSNPPLSQGYNADDDGTCLVSDLTDLTNLDDVGLGQARNNGDLVAATEAGEAGGNGTVRPTMFPLNGSPLVDAIPGRSVTQR